MLFQYPQINQTTEVLNDLISINNDRIAGYQLAMDQSIALDPVIGDVFYQIISEGVGYRQQLIVKVRQLNGNVKSNMTILGKIYKAWMDLKVTFASSSQKAIIGTCLYNEEIALHAYRAALSANIRNMTVETFQLISEQEKGLRKNHDMLRNYRDEVHRTFDSALMYFS